MRPAPASVSAHAYTRAFLRPSGAHRVANERQVALFPRLQLSTHDVGYGYSRGWLEPHVQQDRCTVTYTADHGNGGDDSEGFVTTALKNDD